MFSISFYTDVLRCITFHLYGHLHKLRKQEAYEQKLTEGHLRNKNSSRNGMAVLNISWVAVILLFHTIGLSHTVQNKVEWKKTNIHMSPY